MERASQAGQSVSSAGKLAVRASGKQVTFFINAGTQGLQFAACAGRVIELARAKGEGREIPREWFFTGHQGLGTLTSIKE